MEGSGGLYGREPELGRLAEAVASAAAGQGAVVVLRGDPGIGKSRLLADLADRADAAGFELRAGRGDELGQGRPFGPIAQALQLHPRAEDPEAARVGRLLAGEDELDHAGLPMAGEVRFRVLDTVLALVDRITAHTPLALLLDDAHWADEDTLRVVAALAEQAPTLPLLVALSSRRHPEGPGLATTVRTLEARGAVVLDVTPLDDTAITSVVGELVGGRPGPSLLAEVERAGGNPFLAIELVTAHSASGALVADDGTVELRAGAARVSLAGAVLRRLDHLRPETVELLRAGSVLGRSFSLPVVAALTGRRAVELAVDVDEALAAGLLQSTGDRLTFSHDLVREGIYDALPGAVRSAMHVDAARALAANDAPAFDVATQVERTAGGVDPEVVDWLVLGARQVRVTAPATAAAFLRRAGEVLDPGDERWLEVQALLAEAHVFSGSQLDGQALALQCLDLPELPEAVRADLTYLLGQAQFLLGHLTEAAARFEESAQPGNPNQAAALADGALALLLGGDLAGAADLADRSMAAARERDDVGIEVFVLALLSWVRALEGDLAGGLELGARGIALADSAGTLEVHRNVPWLFYAQVLLWADRDAEANVAIERASELGERLGLVWDIPLRHLLRARAHQRGGDWDRALAEAQAGLSQSNDQGGSIGEVWLLCVIARLTVARGELDDAERALDAAEEAATVSGQGLDQIAWARGLLAEARGDADTAGMYLDLLWDGLQGRGLDYYVWDIAPDVIRLALRRGDRARVDQVLTAVDEIAERTRDSSAPVVAARCRGLADLDPEPFLQAIGLLDVRKAGARPVERALLQAEAAAVLDHAGRAAEASALRAEAEPVLRLAHAVPAGVPGTEPVAVPEEPVTFGWASLTGRELEVVRLLADSLSNAEIAERLFCSRRTVESHLSHAYTKLGISSRVELAVEATRRFADDP